MSFSRKVNQTGCVPCCLHFLPPHLCANPKGTSVPTKTQIPSQVSAPLANPRCSEQEHNCVRWEMTEPGRDSVSVFSSLCASPASSQPRRLPGIRAKSRSASSPFSPIAGVLLGHSSFPPASTHPSFPGNTGRFPSPGRRGLGQPQLSGGSWIPGIKQAQGSWRREHRRDRCARAHVAGVVVPPSPPQLWWDRSPERGPQPRALPRSAALLSAPRQRPMSVPCHQSPPASSLCLKSCSLVGDLLPPAHSSPIKGRLLWEAPWPAPGPTPCRGPSHVR